MAFEIQLEGLHQKVKRKRMLETELCFLYRHQQELLLEIQILEEKKRGWEKWVAKLEKGGFFAWSYSFFGKKREALETERKEAEAVLAEYEATYLELEHVRNSIQLKEAESDTLRGYEEKFHELLKNKRKQLENSGTEKEQAVLEAEKEQSIAAERKETIVAVIEHGEQILAQAEQLEHILKRAERAESARKYAGTNLLDQSQKQTAHLQKEIQEFGKELAAVLKGGVIEENLNVVYQFCNGIYTSYIASGMVMQVAMIERIRGAKGNTRLLRGQIEKLLSQLQEEKEAAEKCRRKAEELTEQLIISR